MSSGVKKLAQVVVGAVIGFVQGGPVGAAVGAGLAFYAAEQQEKLNTKSPLRDNEPSAQTVRSSKAPVRFILGRVSTGGVLVWAQEQSGETASSEWLHLVYVLCEGEIDALENVYLGEEEIGSFGEFASYELIVNPTQVNAFLRANCRDWKDSQIGRGLSFVRVSLRYSAEKFPSGIPDTRFVVRGRRDIYDPRTGSNVYSTNTALHILWFLRNRCNVPDDEIVFDTFASAANVCDETLTNADGSVGQRYRTSCIVGADEQRPSVLQKLEAACAGKLIRVGGRWMLQAGAYYGPYDFEITEDMVIGTVSGSTEPTSDAAINTVRGTFIDPSQSWTETDYPEVSIAEWIVEDGGEAAETLTFSYVTDPYQAQRLANIELRRRRAGGTLSIPMNFSGYNCRPGRVIKVSLPSLNISGEFVVTNWSMGDNEGCTVQVAQYEAPIFDDAVGQPYDPLGFISLPSGGLGSPVGLVWAAASNAEVVQGVLSWTATSGIVSEYAVTVRQGGNAVQSHNVPASSNRCDISGLGSGNYTMSVAAIGPMTRSGEATITVNIYGPPVPEACVVQSSIDSITLIPSNSAVGLNGGTYEYFLSATPQGQPADAVYLGQGLSFTHTGLSFYANYYYFVRSTNAYGKSGFLYVPASTSNDVTAYLAALAGRVTETELGKEIIDRIDLIDGPPSLPGSVNSRLKELDEQVGEVTDQLQEQIDAIGDIADSAGYDPDKPYTDGQSVLFTDGILYQAKGNVPVGTAPPNTTYWTNVGQAVVSAEGVSARVTTAETKITNIEGVNTAQGSAINGLQTSLNGKAEASAVSSLTTRVTATESKNASQDSQITSQSTAITGLQNSVDGKADAATVSALSNEVSQQGETLAAQGTALTSVQIGLNNQDSENWIRNPLFNAGGDLSTNAFTTYVNGSDASVPQPCPSGRVGVVAKTAAGLVTIGLPIKNGTYQIPVLAGETLAVSIRMAVTGSVANASRVVISFYDAANVNLGNSRILNYDYLAGGWQQLAVSIAVPANAVSAGYSIFSESAAPAGSKVFFAEPVLNRLDGASATNASATSALDARVTQTETSITTQSSQIVSLNNSLAGKADNSALQALTSSVTQQGDTLTAQGTALTQVQSTLGGIGGAGTNLLLDTYSWITTGTPPPIGLSAGLSISGLAGEVGSVAGGAIRIQTTDTNTNRQFMLIPINSDVNGRNIPVEPGTYLVSFFAYSNQNVTLRAGLWDSTGAKLGATKVIGTARVRHTFVVNITVAGMAAVIVYPNSDGVVGVPTVYYSFMVEKQIGSGVVASPFTAGSSARSVAAQATAVSSIDTRVTETEGQITIQATRLDGIYAQVNPELAGDTSGYAGSSTGFVGVWSEQSARIEDGVAIGKRVDTVQSVVDDNNATVQEVSQTLVDLDGRAEAMWSVKMQVTQDGQYVVAGVGLGIENTGAGLQSQFLVSADRFAIVNSMSGGAISVPFAVQNGQVFLGSTFIQDGTITNAKIGSFISSTNYVAGQQGWILNKNGTLEINGAVAGGGRLVITNRSVRVYDPSGVKRVQLGDLTE